MSLPVLSLKQMRHECSFYRMNGRDAKVVTHGAYPWYVTNGWDTVAIGYKDEVTYYLVVKDD